ncbi:hypothetical protein LCGC14_0477780 [marine sediment metagenome]|uniref:Uncharacterized protein n=1 Tax=marine sediment metagenome TaxID=412755 RepID=A0A0F9STC5_9ZZZZ
MKFNWTPIIIGFGLFLLFGMLFYIGFVIIDSHNICNAMNLTGC